MLRALVTLCSGARARVVVFSLCVGAAAGACGTSGTSNNPEDAGASPTGSNGVGAPCTPSSEKLATYGGASKSEIGFDTSNPACGSLVCIVNHFRGRVTCPYGQDAQGKAPAGASACVTPGDARPVTGVRVEPQCADRKADQTVHCSCRCANPVGKNDDGASYCTCPSGFVCEQLVTSFGSSTDAIAGAYCVRQSTKFDAGASCVQSCDPATAPCP